MSDLNLSEGQEFYIGGQRYVVKDGVPVQEAKRGPLGGELIKSESLPDDCVAFMKIKKRRDEYDSQHDYYDVVGTNDRIQVPKNNLIEINYGLAHGHTIPKSQQAKGRVMTAGEAARLPDIVGKRVLIECEVNGAEAGFRPLVVSPNLSENPKIDWRLANRIVVEVLD